MKILIRFTPLLLVALLAGCMTPPPSIAQRDAMAGPRPTEAEARGAVQNYLRVALKDYDSIKDFSMQPAFVVDWYTGVEPANHDAGWMQCFDYNAKNGFGAYTGTQRDKIVIKKTQRGFETVSGVRWNGLNSLASRC